MEKEKTTKIHEFDPQIYPFMLWVGKAFETRDVIEKFYSLNLASDTITDFEESDFGIIERFAAITMPVIKKDNDIKGALVLIENEDKYDVGVMAHEASHVCDIFTDLMDLIGDRRQMFINGEPRAYIVQWAADCINKVKNNKIK